MTDVLLVYRRMCRNALDGRVYTADACADQSRDGTTRWHGWLKFWPLGGGPALTTGRETTQPNRMCTVYWATGLTPTYLDGALGRAIDSRIRRAAALQTHHTHGCSIYR